MNEETPQPKSTWARTKSLLLFTNVICCLVIAVATCLRPFAMLWWVADLFCQFAVQYVLLLLPIAMVFALLKRWRWLVFSTLVLGINLSVIWPYLPVQTSGTRPYAEEANSPLRLLTLNVLTKNRQYKRTIELVKQENPDFIVLIEIDQDWVDHMKPIHKQYPHRMTRVHSGNFGIGIYSKIAWEECKIVESPPAQLPSVFASFASKTGNWQLVGTHPYPPTGKNASNHRNEQLIAIAEQLRGEAPCILTGDFNLTPWSPWFAKTLRIANLQDSARGINITPTWHAFPTILGGVKIDHVLHRGISILSSRVAPNVGSDHRSVIVDFLPYPARN